MSTGPGVLSEDQIEQFLQKGYLVVKNCFSRNTARQWTDRAYLRLGYHPNDPASWKQSRVHMPAMDRWEVKEFAPKAWDAITEVVGGEDRIKLPCSWGDGFIINFCDGADQPWRPPTAESPGWHKDGDWFVHYLDSPEQGLLVIVVWADIRPKGGGTFISTDSVPVVARYLLEHPGGLQPNEFPFRELAAQCHEFMEVTGEVGDVVLLHPFILHASSQNPSGVPRFITNPAISLNAPMEFNRTNPADSSLMERAILRGLGVEKLDFTIAGERARVIPERELRQKKMLDEERARLAGQLASS